MQMRIDLIKVRHKAEDVVLTPFPATPVIHVLRPFLNLRHSMEVAMVFGMRERVIVLIAKSQFQHTLTITA